MSSIQTKYFVVVFVAVMLGFVAVGWKTCRLTGKERALLVHMGDSLHKKQREEEPRRGNIFSDDGRLLAASAPVYRLCMDMTVDSLRVREGENFHKHVDSLALCLARKFGDKSKEEYKLGLKNAYRKKSRFYELTRKTLSHVDFNEVKGFPLLRWGARGGLVVNGETMRVLRSFPYGNLGEATIGRLPDRAKGTGLRGLEAACDSFLSGKAGVANLERRAGADIWVAERKSENGADVITTLNVDMQDLAEKALREKLVSLNADLGCVVIMEVKTGQIKACVNLRKQGEGRYSEQDNIALTSQPEPGSTFKVPVMMAAMEEGKISPTDSVDCGAGKWEVMGKVMEDKPANYVIPIEQVIVRSSNIGMSKLMYANYNHNPSALVEALRRIGVGRAFDVGFGSKVARAKIAPDNVRPNSWDINMSFGYSVAMPLLYTLTFYNAIANEGTMMSPYFVKAIMHEKDTVQRFAPKVLQQPICSPQTLADIRHMMLQVVEDSVHGTGKKVKSPFVRIAGKTGTARYQYKKDETVKHRVSFCGFFPYDTPRYTCIVFIENPQGTPSGGAMAGTVFRDIAERTMAVMMQASVDDFCRRRAIVPPAASPLDRQTQLPATIRGTVPDVRGLGLSEAVFVVESAGLKAEAQGRGRVASQTPAAGTRMKANESVRLVLR